MSWFTDFMHPGQAYGRAANANQQGYEQGQGMRQPFIEQGQQAGGDIMSMLQKLMNPGALQDEWSKGYNESDYAKQGQAQAQANGLDAASAMGLGGSSAALSNIQNQTSAIGQQDKQQYMQDMMQKYMAAMGLGSNIYGQGANMSAQGANAAGQFGNEQAGYLGNKAAAGGNMFGNIMGGAAGLAGGVLGGPIGGAIGNWLGGKMGNQPNQFGNRY
jgi:hypothetical protein